MTRRWCCVWLIALTVTVAARPADQDRHVPERPALTGLDAAAVETLIGAPANKDELADSNEAYWTFTTPAGALILHFQNSVVVDIDPADFPVERILRSAATASATSPWTAYVNRFLAEPAHQGDLSAASFGEDLVRTRARLAELRAMDGSRLSKDDVLDRRFVETLLVRREIEQARMRRWRMDPRVYMQSLQALALRLAVAGDRKPQAAAVLRLLKAIPQEFRFGRRNLTLSIPGLQALALTVASAGRTTLTTRVAAFAETVPEQKDALLAASDTARAALTDWTDYLSKELPKRPAGYMMAGIDTFSAILQGEFLIQYSLDELYEFTRREFERTQEQLKSAAAEIDESRPWLVVAGDMGTDADDLNAEALNEIYRAAGETARTNLDASFFVAVPWREAIAEWRFTKDDSSRAALFGAVDPAVVSIQAYAGYGDRARTLYQSHNPSAVRRERGAATFTRGWQLYVELLLEEKKLVPDRAALRLLQLRLLAIVRVAVDIGFHTHRMTDTEALSFLTDRVGLTKAAADQELAGVIEDPGSGLGYLGLTEIARLREDVQKARGGEFSLADFHERLLKAGPMPLTLVRAALLD